MEGTEPFPLEIIIAMIYLIITKAAGTRPRGMRRDCQQLQTDATNAGATAPLLDIVLQCRKSL